MIVAKMRGLGRLLILLRIGTKTLNVTLENLLLTSTNVANSLAFAEKKFVGLSLITGGAVTPVPEAETYSMMLAGLGLLGLMVARRTRFESRH